VSVGALVGDGVLFLCKVLYRHMIGMFMNNVDCSVMVEWDLCPDRYGFVKLISETSFGYDIIKLYSR